MDAVTVMRASPRVRRLVRMAAPLLVLGVMEAPLPTWAQSHADAGPALVDAVMSVEPGPDGTSYVEVRYRVRPADQTAIPLQLVLLDGVSVAGVSARVWEDAVPVELSLRGPAPRGRIALPEALLSAEVPLVVRYRVRGGIRQDGEEHHLHVPVLAVSWPPVEALPGTFTARVNLTGGLRVTGGFPSGWKVESRGGGATVVRTDLPVLPSLISVRARTVGTGPGLTLSQALSAFVLLVLLGVAGAGVRFLRRQEP